MSVHPRSATLCGMGGLLFVIAVAACNKKAASHRVDMIESSTFTMVVPVGWNVIDDPPTKKAAPDAIALISTEDSERYRPTAMILPVVPNAAEPIQDATIDNCRDWVQKPALADHPEMTPGPIKIYEDGHHRGCDVILIHSITPQLSRSLAFNDGNAGFVVVCNFDKAGAPKIEADCEQMAKAITPK
jgi:hypothetical protein